MLDTAHSLPGEYLDFIVALPYIKDGGLVVLHDVIDAHQNILDTEIATSLLFSTVHTKKWYMHEAGMNLFDFSNISAFEVNQELKNNLDDIFWAITIPWIYIFSDDETEAYLNCIRKNYPDIYVKSLENTFKLQKRYHTSKEKKITKDYIKQRKVQTVVAEYVAKITKEELGVDDCRNYLWQTPYCPRWELLVRITSVEENFIQVRIYQLIKDNEGEESVDDLKVSLVREAEVELYISGKALAH